MNVLFFTVYERTSAGVEEGIIIDDQLKSSNHPDDPHPAHEGRLNFPGAWCGNTMREQLFLQVDFLVNFQGRIQLVEVYLGLLHRESDLYTFVARCARLNYLSSFIQMFSTSTVS